MKMPELFHVHGRTDSTGFTRRLELIEKLEDSTEIIRIVGNALQVYTGSHHTNINFISPLQLVLKMNIMSI